MKSRTKAAASLGNQNRRKFIVACLGTLCLYMAHTSRAAGAKRFKIDIKDGRVARENHTIRVTEGDAVEIELTSDRVLNLHLHGIDIESVIGPGKPVRIQFNATVTGRFPMEAHGAATRGNLIYVEVYPR